MNGAIYVSDSGNTKIMGSRKADATYASIDATCPVSCPLNGEGCYAQTSGHLGILARRLNGEGEGQDVTKAEVKAIDSSYNGGPVPKGRDLRLHVMGDSRTVRGTRALASAVARWKARGGGAAWNYTHAWRAVHRKEWGPVSTLASCEDSKQAKLVRAQGYAPALVVAEHASDKAYVKDGVRWIPCPSQTRGVGCTDCRLCFDADALFKRRAGIAFAAHGARKNVVKLTVLQPSLFK